MSKKRSTVYVPENLWSRALTIARRDGLKLSNIVEDLLREWVATHEPGNPQRPITAWIEGHRDQLVLVRIRVLERCRVLAKWKDGVTRKEIRRFLREEGVDRKAMKVQAETVRLLLRGEGVKVWV